MKRNRLTFVLLGLALAGVAIGGFGCVGAGVAVEEGPVYYGPEYGPDPWFYGGRWIDGRRWEHRDHPRPDYHVVPPLHGDRDHPTPHLPDRPRPPRPQGIPHPPPPRPPTPPMHAAPTQGPGAPPPRSTR